MATRQQIIDAVARGEQVSFGGRIIRNVQDVPSQAQLDAANSPLRPETVGDCGRWVQFWNAGVISADLAVPFLPYDGSGRNLEIAWQQDAVGGRVVTFDPRYDLRYDVHTLEAAQYPTTPGRASLVVFAWSPLGANWVMAGGWSK